MNRRDFRTPDSYRNTLNWDTEPGITLQLLLLYNISNMYTNIIDAFGYWKAGNRLNFATKMFMSRLESAQFDQFNLWTK